MASLHTTYAKIICPSRKIRFKDVQIYGNKRITALLGKMTLKIIQYQQEATVTATIFLMDKIMRNLSFSTPLRALKNFLLQILIYRSDAG